jgi:hypothetical protein
MSPIQKNLWLPTFLGKMGVLSSLDYIYFEGDIEEMHYSFCSMC